ncbi:MULTISPECIES: beta-galactosidase [unclassified Streptomyces]|uniref:beta-galactosidase n=1 Tax=Streptomyces sp. T21Q-yed TaxID=3018441 RepID=UPI002366F91B|nr:MULTISPECIES: beta-galactosidase [unclassified Streptomyces]MDF3144794.1 beta-galactosidase [Streptomyces sp. T21Q-yed]WDF36092.1 beta-galactosidase [Streptomyces sp. T12]
MPHLSDATRGRLLLLTKQAGVNSVTLGVFSWSTLEPEPWAWEFGRPGTLTDLMHANGIDVQHGTTCAIPPSSWTSGASPPATSCRCGSARTPGRWAEEMEQAAEADLTWAADGARAVLRPTRTVCIGFRTSSGDAEPIDLVAGEDHVLSMGSW